jgi:scyllo-inositol 2-dehydrogenase (NADP+)
MSKLNVLVLSSATSPKLSAIVENLTGAGWNVNVGYDGAALARLASGDFHCVVVHEIALTPKEVETVAEFVRAGGGAVQAGLGHMNEPMARLTGISSAEQGPRCEFTIKISDAEHPIAHRIRDFSVTTEFPRVELGEAKMIAGAYWDNHLMPVIWARGRVVTLAITALDHPSIRQFLTRAVRYAGGQGWSNKTVKVAAIGYGGAFNMGKGHLESCSRNRMKPVAVCDSDPKRTATAKQELGDHIQTFTSADDLLEKSDAELVIVITPHNTHAPLAIKCLDAGRHVVTEKPFTMTVDEATQVIHAAERNKKMASVFHNRRWDGDFMTIRRLVESGAIGDVFKIECAWGNFAAPKADWWRADKSITGGALHDWGAHFTDWVLQLMPYEIESVSGFFLANKVWPNVSIEDHAEATIRFAGGRIAHIETSAIAAVNKQRFRILGTSGAIEHKGWDMKEPLKLVQYREGITTETNVRIPDGDWDGYYRNIADHLIIGEELIVKPEEARRTIAVATLAEESSQRGGVPIAMAI